MILGVVIPVLTKTNRDMNPQILKYKECLLHMTSRWNALHWNWTNYFGDQFKLFFNSVEYQTRDLSLSVSINLHPNPTTVNNLLMEQKFSQSIVKLLNCDSIFFLQMIKTKKRTMYFSCGFLKPFSRALPFGLAYFRAYINQPMQINKFLCIIYKFLR